MRLRLDETAKRRTILATMAVAVIFLSFVLQLSWSPRFELIGSDSGFYAYGAQEILSGRLLYRDFFDNHLQGIFYIDALAMSVAGQSPWAIWWLGVVWIAVSSLVFLITMAKLTDNASAFLGSILLLMTLMYPNYYQGGNFTEIYALLPQILGIAALAAFFSSKRSLWVAVLGLLCALTFLFKQTNIAIFLAAILVILLADVRAGQRGRILLHTALFGAGVVIPLVGTSLYWAAYGALQDLWQAAVMSNLVYSGQFRSIVNLYGLIRALVIIQPLSSLFTVAIAGAGVFIIRNRAWLIEKPSLEEALAEANEPSPETRDETWKIWTLLCIFLSIPIEVILLALSGRNLGHSFLTPLPILAAAGTYLFSQVKMSFANWRDEGKGTWWIVSMIMLALLMAAWGIEVLVKEAPQREHLASLTMPLHGEYKVDELHEFVLENSGPTESVLVWGFHPDINFLTQRRAPSRYLYHPFLFYPNSNREDRFKEFLEALSDDPPGLILAQEESASEMPFFGAEGEALCPGCSADGRAGMEQLKAYVETQYVLVKGIGNWLIYERNP